MKISSAVSKSALNSGLLTILNQVVASGSNFVTGVIIGRACTKDEFGLYMLGFSVVLFITDLQVSLVSTPYMVFRPRLADDELRLYNGSSLLLNLVLSLICMTALAASGLLLSSGFGPPGLASVFFALALVTGLIMLREFIRRVCFASLDMKSAFLFDLCIALAQVAGVLLLSGTQLLSPGRAYLVTGLASGSAAAAWCFLNRAEFIISWRNALADFKKHWCFGRWILASGLLWTVGMNLYPWLLTSFHGTASAGVWGACVGVLALVNVPTLGLLNLLGPQIAKAYAEGGVTALRRFTFQATALVFSVMAVLSAVLLLTGDTLLPLLYGKKYSGHGTVVFLLALNLIASGVSFPFSRGLFVLERADIEFKTTFVPLLILFTCGLWLVRLYGPMGAALGLLMANIASVLVRGAFFLSVSRPPVKELTEGVAL